MEQDPGRRPLVGASNRPQAYAKARLLDARLAGTPLELAVVPGHLWVVTVSGKIFQQNKAGQWTRLNSGQLGGARLVSLSISQAGQVWAVDEAGLVYMRLGSLQPPPPHALPVWLPLEGEEEPGEGARLVEVVCSSTGHLVWARDTMQGVWARQGVYPDLPIGSGWAAVTGLAVTRLAVSRTSVWALSSSGGIYRFPAARARW